MAHCLVEIYIENDTKKIKRGDYSEKNFIKSKTEWLKDGRDQKNWEKRKNCGGRIETTDS